MFNIVNMELLNLLKKKNIYDFNTVRNILTNEPYNLIIKEDNSYPNLYMVTYDKNNSNLHDPVVKQCRGIILEKESNKIICYTFNKGNNIEANDNIDNNTLKILDQLDWKSTKVELSIDGTQIRLFYYQNEWRYATTRCIDAKKARWFTCNNFYDLFKDADYVINYNKLDKNCCYSFVLCHPKNRIVVKYNKPKLVHVLTRNLITFDEIDTNIGVEKPRRFKKFNSYNDIISDAINNNNLDEGYMLCDNKRFRVKIKNKTYCKIKELRGNTNNLFYHYLQLRYNNLIEPYLSFYPEFKNKFALYELDIHNLAHEIHKLYINKHIKNSTDRIPKHFNTMIYKLHGNYLSTFEKTTVIKIIEELNKLHPSQICFMYNKTFTPHHPFKSE